MAEVKKRGRKRRVVVPPHDMTRENLLIRLANGPMSWNDVRPGGEASEVVRLSDMGIVVIGRNKGRAIVRLANEEEKRQKEAERCDEA